VTVVRAQGHANAWWTSVLFSIGSALFAVGAIPGYAGWVGVPLDSLTFFVGSVFFTGAGYLQYTGSAAAASAPPRMRPSEWSPAGSGLAWAALIQLAGTVWFNISTFNALRSSLSVAQQDRLVWRPDALGSICFLIASTIVLAMASRVSGWWRPRLPDWASAALNMLGSVAFGVSAIAAYVVPDSGAVRNAQMVNLGTFAGAICFLIAAVITLPRSPRRT
jgi:hypothetical protein